MNIRSVRYENLTLQEQSTIRALFTDKTEALFDDLDRLKASITELDQPSGFFHRFFYDEERDAVMPAFNNVIDALKNLTFKCYSC